MHQSIYLKSSILQDFRAFYRELLVLQGMALEHTFSPEEDPGENHQTIGHQIQARLESLLMNQYKSVGSQKGGYAAHYYRQAQYIMVALADEIFINLNWHGNEEWKDHLLESFIYNTQDAGEKFFQNLDEFLETDGFQGVDMAALYLMALGLGFKGKYRGTSNEKKLFGYREKLYHYIAVEDAELLQNKSPLFPQTYENIIEDRQNADMPDVRPWWIGLGVILIGFISLSSLIWLTHMNNFSPFVNTLEKWAGI